MVGDQHIGELLLHVVWRGYVLVDISAMDASINVGHVEAKLVGVGYDLVNRGVRDVR